MPISVFTLNPRLQARVVAFIRVAFAGSPKAAGLYWLLEGGWAVSAHLERYEPRQQVVIGLQEGVELNDVVFPSFPAFVNSLPTECQWQFNRIPNVVFYHVGSSHLIRVAQLAIFIAWRYVYPVDDVDDAEHTHLMRQMEEQTSENPGLRRCWLENRRVFQEYTRIVRCMKNFVPKLDHKTVVIDAASVLCSVFLDQRSPVTEEGVLRRRRGNTGPKAFFGHIIRMIVHLVFDVEALGRVRRPRLRQPEQPDRCVRQRFEAQEEGEEVGVEEEAQVVAAVQDDRFNGEQKADEDPEVEELRALLMGLFPDERQNPERREDAA